MGLEPAFGNVGIAMPTYSSFLIRCWLRGDEAPPSYAVQHVQSREEFRGSDLPAVMAWIDRVSHLPSANSGEEATDGRQ